MFGDEIVVTVERQFHSLLTSNFYPQMREGSPFPGADFVKKVFGHFYTLGKRINTNENLGH